MFVLSLLRVCVSITEGRPGVDKTPQGDSSNAGGSARCAGAWPVRLSVCVPSRTRGWRGSAEGAEQFRTASLTPGQPRCSGQPHPAPLARRASRSRDTWGSARVLPEAHRTVLVLNLARFIISAGRLFQKHLQMVKAF